MRLLVIDDDPAIRDLATRALVLDGHDVDSDASGEAALRRTDQQFEVVLTDLMMPGAVDGNAVVRHFRSHGNADVMVVTGYPELESAIQALHDGAYDYVVKPFTDETLRLAVRRCIDHRRLSRELARERALRAELDAAYRELRAMAGVREIFGQFISPEIARLAVADPETFWRQGERRVVTVLFADIRGFTTFTAAVSPEETTASLNEVFAQLCDAVQAEGGIVNKFLGDGMLAIFGAPVERPDSAAAAARAALRMRRAVARLAARRRRTGRVPLYVGIGLNTDEVVAGCVGTRERTEYAVVGNGVNLAARLVERAAPGEILIGPGTVAALGRRFVTRGQGDVTLRGIGSIALASLEGANRLPRPPGTTSLSAQRRVAPQSSTGTFG